MQRPKKDTGYPGTGVTGETEVDESLNSGSAQSTKCVLGQPGLQRETMSQKAKQILKPHLKVFSRKNTNVKSYRFEEILIIY